LDDGGSTVRARVSEKATVGVVFTAAVFMSALDVFTSFSERSV